MGGKQSFPRVEIPKDRVFVVTGANRGIGYATAKWIAMLGGTVIMACRSEDAAMEAIRRIGKEYNDEKIKGTPGLVDVEELSLEFMELNLASFASTKSFVEAFKASGRQLHVLICNAAVFKAKPETTENGFETMLQVNYLSHFLIIGLLLPHMKKSGDDIRIVLVSSEAHGMCRYNIDAINYSGPEDKFSSLEYYGKSKLYQVMQMHSLERRLRNTNVSVTSVHPGMVDTDMGAEVKDLVMYKVYVSMTRMLGIMRSLEDGAATSINCAINPDLKGKSGIYFKNCKAANSSSVSMDETKQEELWTTTMKLMLDHFTEDEVYCLEGADPV